LNINTANEDQHRPAYDVAKSALSKAQDALTKEQDALRDAQAKLDAFNDKLDNAAKLPKNAAHDGGELEAAVSFHTRRVAKSEQAVSETQATLEQAQYALTEAQVLDRAETVAAFDYNELAAEFAAEVQPIVDRYMETVYAVSKAEAEAVHLGQSIGLDARIINPANRARLIPDTGRYHVSLDGNKLPTVYPSRALGELRESLRDTRYDAEVAEAQRLERERRAEEEARRIAERERAEAYRRAEQGMDSATPIRYADGARPMTTVDGDGRPLGPAQSMGRGAVHTAGSKRHG